MTPRPALLVLCAWLGANGAHAIEVRDDTGRAVHLDEPARRVVTLAPHATELVVAAGGATSLVAVTDGGTLPRPLASLPRIGGPGGLDRERLLQLKPDLVVGWQSGNLPGDLAWIADTGTALFRSEPRLLDDVADSIRALGKLIGKPDTADRAAARFEASLLTACLDLPRIPVYVSLWDRPALSLGGRHWLNDVLHRAGYRNVLAAQDRGVISVAGEVRLALSSIPRVSLVRRFDGSAEDALAGLLSRPGPRLADALQTLCRRRLAQVAPP